MPTSTVTWASGGHVVVVVQALCARDHPQFDADGLELVDDGGGAGVRARGELGLAGDPARLLGPGPTDQQQQRGGGQGGGHRHHHVAMPVRLDPTSDRGSWGLEGGSVGLDVVEARGADGAAPQVLDDVLAVLDAQLAGVEPVEGEHREMAVPREQPLSGVDDGIVHGASTPW